MVVLLQQEFMIYFFVGTVFLDNYFGIIRVYQGDVFSDWISESGPTCCSRLLVIHSCTKNCLLRYL